jgi:hypothetical protein
MAPTILKGNSFAQPNRAALHLSGRAKALELSRNSLKIVGSRKSIQVGQGIGEEKTWAINRTQVELATRMARKSDPIAQKFEGRALCIHAPFCMHNCVLQNRPTLKFLGYGPPGSVCFQGQLSIILLAGPYYGDSSPTPYHTIKFLPIPKNYRARGAYYFIAPAIIYFRGPPIKIMGGPLLWVWAHIIVGPLK